MNVSRMPVAVSSRGWIQALQPVELSSCQRHGAERAAGPTPGVCSTTLPGVSYSLTSLGSEMEKEQSLLQQHSASFIPSGFSSLSEFTRQCLCTKRTRVCIPAWTEPSQPTHLERRRAPGSAGTHALPCFRGCCSLCRERIYDLLYLGFQRRLGWRQQFPLSFTLPYEESWDFWMED